MKAFRNAAAAAVALLAPIALTGAAQATTITFTDYDVTGPQLTGVFGGVQVTATAATWTQGGFDAASGTGTGTIDLYGPVFDSAVLDASSYGLALQNSFLDSHLIDGFGLKDIVLFEFDAAVRLTELAFSFVDADDDFVLFVGDGTGALSAFSLMDVLTGSVALDVVGRSFGIGAFDASDNFKLTAMTFEAAPVPVPAAALLFLAGLGLAGAARRRR